MTHIEILVSPLHDHDDHEYQVPHVSSLLDVIYDFCVSSLLATVYVSTICDTVP